MTDRRRLATAIVLAALLGATATWVLTRAGSTDTAPDRSSSTALAGSATGAKTALPGLAPASGEPALPGLAGADVMPGSVTQVAGPFDDRFALSRLRYREGRVSGLLTVTSDVSALLELQVVAGFYDERGKLLGTGRYVHHSGLHDEAGHGAGLPRESFVIDAPRRARSEAVAAAVGVPVLVNE